jgi:hypothetical protein
MHERLHCSWGGVCTLTTSDHGWTFFGAKDPSREPNSRNYKTYVISMFLKRT